MNSTDVLSPPRLTSKLGDKLYRKWEEDEREDKRKEEILWDLIRKLRKEKNKVRRKNDEAEHQPKEKRKGWILERRMEEMEKRRIETRILEKQ